MADNLKYDELIPAFHFVVAFVEDGQTLEQSLKLGFSEVSGLGIEIQTEDIMEGGGNNYVLRLPKPPKFKNLVLKKALAKTTPGIIEWAKNAVENFMITTRTVVVSLYDFEDNPIKSWNFEGAYPVKLSVSDFNSNKNEVVIETLELAYRRFYLTTERK